MDVQEIMKDQLIAYSTTRILLYAQSFAFLTSASQQNQWNLNLGEVARVLCGGSVIRCKLLQKYELVMNVNVGLPRYMRRNLNSPIFCFLRLSLHW